MSASRCLGPCALRARPPLAIIAGLAIALLSVTPQTVVASSAPLGWEDAAVVRIGDRTIETRRALLHGFVVDGVREVTIDRVESTFRRVHGTLPSPRTPLPTAIPLERWSDVDDWLVAEGIDPSRTIAPPGLPEARWVESPGGDLRLALGHRLHLEESGRQIELWVEAEQGIVLAARDLVRSGGPSVSVVGHVPVDALPHSATVAMSTFPLSDLRVLAAGLAPLFTDLAGTVALPSGTTSGVVTASLTGTYVDVENQGGPDTSVIANLTGGGLVLEFGSSGSEFSTAEVNGYLVPSLARLWLLSIAPNLPAADVPVTVHVNVAGSCFASYLPLFQAIQCTRAGGGCANAAYGTLLAHEWFHHIQAHLPISPELEVEEANADVFAAYCFGDPLIAGHFTGFGTSLRDLSAPATYPVASAQPQESGLPLAAAFWDLRTELMATLGTNAGAHAAAELWLTWVIAGSGVLDPGTLAELLELDDDDGDLSNGTPHAAALLTAFPAHGLGLPLAAATNFTCARLEGDVHLTWSLPVVSAHDAIEIHRDGVLLETLSPAATSSVDLDVPGGFHEWSVVLRLGPAAAPSAACPLEVPTLVPFIRGDVTGDTTLDLADGVTLLNALFSGGPPLLCPDAGDLDDDGSLDLADPLLLLGYLFQWGAPPPEPFPGAGADPTPDALLCE